jgi:PTS system sucrose-specific IIC component
MYTTIDVSMLGNLGVTYWLPIASAANIAQGGACLAVALKTKNEKTKALAVPSGISCLLGITEPAIFGVNLPKLKPFIAGMIGAAVGAFICSITQLGATGTGVTGLFGILLCINQPLQYIIMFCAAFGVAFAITFAIYSDEAAPAKAASKSVAAAAPAAQSIMAAYEPGTVVAPMTGEAIAMTSVADPVFASEAMGKGVAIEPTEGNVYAPVTGEVTMVAGSGHAVGLMADDGTEVLIHIGIDTVELNGAPFTVVAKTGDKVKAGDLLVEADLGKIKTAGKPTTTMVIVTNTDDYASVNATLGATQAGKPVIRLTK